MRVLLSRRVFLVRVQIGHEQLVQVAARAAAEGRRHERKHVCQLAVRSAKSTRFLRARAPQGLEEKDMNTALAKVIELVIFRLV